MSQFAVNQQRLDPYKNFKVQLKWDGKAIAGVTKVSALKRSTEVIEVREGSDPSTTRRLPGRTKYEPITLERGLSYDPSFELWANPANGSAATSENGIAGARKNITIEILDECGRTIISYKVFRCWVSEYQAFSDLDSNANAVAFELIKLENEGWERDPSVTEPKESVDL